MTQRIVKVMRDVAIAMMLLDGVLRLKVSIAELADVAGG